MPELVVVLFLYAAAVSLLRLRAHRHPSVLRRVPACGGAVVCVVGAWLVTHHFLHWTVASGVWVAGPMTVAILVLMFDPLHPRLLAASGMVTFLGAVTGAAAIL